MEMLLGCLLGLLVVGLAIWFDALWWMRIWREDRIGGPIWLGLAVLYAVVAATVFGERALSALELGCLVGVAVAHGVWGISLLRDWSRSLAFRLMTHVTLGGVGVWAVWLLGTDLGRDPFPTGGDEALNRVWWLSQLGDGWILEHRKALLLLTLAVAIALVHTPRWAPNWPRRWRWFGRALSLPDVLVTALVWVGVVTGVWIAADGIPGLWEPPDIHATWGLVTSSALGVGLYTAMLVACALAYALARHLKPAELERLSLKAMAQPWRPRLTLPDKPSISKLWSNPLPTTGAATVAFTSMALMWALDTSWGAVPLVLSALLMPLAAIRAFSFKAPFGAHTVDLKQRESVEALTGVHWVDGRLLLDKWRVRDNEDLGGEGAPEVLTGWSDRLVFEPEFIERVGVRPGEVITTIFDVEEDTDAGEEGASAPGDADEASEEATEGEDSEPPSHAVESAKRAWSFEVVYRGRSFFVDECVGNEAVPRLEAMADLWFLGEQLGCPVRQPHRLIHDPSATSGQIAERVAGTYRAFATSSPDSRERYAEALETWCHREDEQGRAWWLIPKGKHVLGGVWFLLLVWLVGVGELVMSLLPGADFRMMFPGSPLLIDYMTMLRLMLLGGFGVAIVDLWLKRRSPDIYALRFGRDGIQLQDTVVSWHEVIDLNLLPAVDFPPAFVTEGRLVGLPLLLSTDAQLALAAEAGRALARHRVILDRDG